MKIKKGDKVQVTAGRDSGKTGTVDRVYAGSQKVLIQGINNVKRHVPKSQEIPQGGVVEVPRPIAVSKLMLMCPKCSKLTRVGYKVDKNRKVRFCKKCKNNI